MSYLVPLYIHTFKYNGVDMWYILRKLSLFMALLSYAIYRLAFPNLMLTKPYQVTFDVITGILIVVALLPEGVAGKMALIVLFRLQLAIFSLSKHLTHFHELPAETM